MIFALVMTGAALLVLLTAILFIPVTLEGGVEGYWVYQGGYADEDDKDFRLEAGIVWLFGIVRMRIYHHAGEHKVQASLFGVTADGGKWGRRRSRPKVSNRKSTSGYKKRKIVLHPNEIVLLLKEGVGLLRRIFRSFDMDLRGHIEYGFSEPYVTGLMTAFLSIDGMPRKLTWTPRFTESCLRGHLSFKNTVVPVQIVWICGLFMLKHPVRTIGWRQLKSFVGRPSTRYRVTRRKGDVFR